MNNDTAFFLPPVEQLCVVLWGQGSRWLIQHEMFYIFTHDIDSVIESFTDHQ
jgi:hypothetical protein